MADQYRVTSAGMNPAEDRSHRMRVYFITMTLRMACVASLFWVRGWWILLAAAGAVILPYFAVLMANAVGNTTDGERPEPPAPLELEAGAADDARPDASETLIVIDAPADRRKSGGES